MLDAQREVVLDKRLHPRHAIPDKTEDDKLLWAVRHLFGAMQVLYVEKTHLGCKFQVLQVRQYNSLRSNLVVLWVASTNSSGPPAYSHARSTADTCRFPLPATAMHRPWDHHRYYRWVHPFPQPTIRSNSLHRAPL